MKSQDQFQGPNVRYVVIGLSVVFLLGMWIQS